MTQTSPAYYYHTHNTINNCDQHIFLEKSLHKQEKKSKNSCGCKEHQNHKQKRKKEEGGKASVNKFIFRHIVLNF